MLERSRTSAPLYQQLMAEIQRYLKENHLQPGDMVPTERQLQEWYGVSRFTVRRALEELEIAGVIERHQGHGTFVALPHIENRLPELTGFTEEMIQRGYRAETVLLSFETVTDSDILAAFPRQTKAAVRFARLRFANAQPIGIHDTYIAQALAVRLGITRERLSQDRSFSFYAELTRHGIDTDTAEQRIGAKPASEFEARHLGVRQGHPLITFDRRTYTSDRQLIELTRAIYLAGKYEYTVVLKRRPEGNRG